MNKLTNLSDLYALAEADSIKVDCFSFDNCQSMSIQDSNGNCYIGIRGKHEQTANRWAVKKLVPKAELVRLLKKGFARWELAEHFEVTEDFINLAIRMYFEYGIT